MLTGTELVKAMYQKAILDADNRRKDEASKLLDYYNDSSLSYILDDIRARYVHPEKLYPCSVNIVKKIVRALAMVYMRDAVRSVDGTEQDRAILAEIETTAAMPVKMKQANRMARLLGVILLRPVWRNGRMDLDVLTPDVLDVETGDTPQDLQAVQVTHYSATGDANEVTYALWTSETVQIMDANGRQISEEENPYKRLPFVPCWRHPVGDVFWQHGASDLLMIQDAVTRLLTLAAYVLDHQGFATCYVKGAEGRLADDVAMGPGSLVGLPRDGEIGYVSPQAPAEKILAVVDFLLKQAAVTNGLPAATMSTEPTEESGVSRIVGNRELEEMRADDVALFAEYERQLFDVFRTVWNVHNPGRQISADAVFQINFADPRPTMTATEQISNWERLMALGLASPVDAVMERDPDLTRDEAKARLLMIRDEMAEFGANFVLPT